MTHLISRWLMSQFYNHKMEMEIFKANFDLLFLKKNLVFNWVLKSKTLLFLVLVIHPSWIVSPHQKIDFKSRSSANIVINNHTHIRSFSLCDPQQKCGDGESATLSNEHRAPKSFKSLLYSMHYIICKTIKSKVALYFKSVLKSDIVIQSSWPALHIVQFVQTWKKSNWIKNLLVKVKDTFR